MRTPPPAKAVGKTKRPGSGRISPAPPEVQSRDRVYEAAQGLARKGGAFTKSGKPKGSGGKKMKTPT
jgi:hypothetical protein